MFIGFLDSIGDDIKCCRNLFKFIGLLVFFNSCIFLVVVGFLFKKNIKDKYLKGKWVVCKLWYCICFKYVIC